MNLFTKGYQAIRSTLPSTSDTAKHTTVSSTPVTQQVRETIDKLCDRILHGTMIEDRRASVMALKGLSKEYQLEVGTRSMPALLHILAADQADLESIRAALETLANICTPHQSSREEHLGATFTEILMKESKNVALLLGFLKIHDFHIRLQTIYCLSVLSTNRTKQMQESILEDPLGIPLLVDLLDDYREIIRN
jgi:hypothetical protein